jgi:hypothetical protein
MYDLPVIIRKRLDFSIFADHRQLFLKVSGADGRRRGAAVSTAVLRMQQRQMRVTCLVRITKPNRTHDSQNGPDR